MAKWISVEDKLPTTDGLFFVFGRRVAGRNQRFIYMAWHNTRTGGWFFDTTFHDVTHWRHMIMPPRQQRESTHA